MAGRTPSVPWYAPVTAMADAMPVVALHADAEHREARPGEHALQRLGPLAHGLELRKRHERVGLPTFRMKRERDQSLGLMHRQLAQDDRVVEREHGARAADPERERDDAEGGKEAVPCQQAQPEPHVLHHRRERAGAPHVARDLADERHVAEGAMRRGAGVVGRRTAFHAQPRLFREVEGDLVVHVTLGWPSSPLPHGRLLAAMPGPSRAQSPRRSRPSASAPPRAGACRPASGGSTSRAACSR